MTRCAFYPFILAFNVVDVLPDKESLPRGGQREIQKPSNPEKIFLHPKTESLTLQFKK